MGLYNKNLEVLKKKDPGLALRVGPLADSLGTEIVSAKNGQAVPRVRSINLHSVYDPTKEAIQTVAHFSQEVKGPVVVLGLGFAYHVLELLKKAQGKIIVIEPSMDLFRTFLKSVDITPFSDSCKFLISEWPEKILSRHHRHDWNIFIHRPSVQLNESYFKRLETGLSVKEYLMSHRLKVLVVNPIYGGSLPTARYSKLALKAMGHDVESVDCDQFEDSFFALKNVTKNKNNTEILSNMFLNLMMEVILAKAVEFQPDLILALAQAPLSKEALGRLKPLNIPIAFWFVEDFKTLTYWKDVASWYDYFFCIQRGEFQEKLRSLSVDSYYLPQACAPSVQKPMDLTLDDRKVYKADVSFMGAAYYNRIQSFPQLLNYDLKIWGTGWDKRTPVGPCVQNDNDRISAEKAVKIFNAGKINLNLHSSSFHESVNPNGDFVNPRTFEIASSGGFQLVDDRKELHDLFDTESELVTFRDMEDLKKKIDYYLENEDERNAIASRSRERVLKEHTMEHRMMEMLLHIFMDRFDELQMKLEKRSAPFDFIMDQAGEDSELADYLKDMSNDQDYSIQNILSHINEGEGKLSKNEMLLLMVGQVIKEEI